MHMNTRDARQARPTLQVPPSPRANLVPGDKVSHSVRDPPFQRDCPSLSPGMGLQPRTAVLGCFYVGAEDLNSTS